MKGKLSNPYRFSLAVSFEEKYRHEVLALVGYYYGAGCINFGAPVSFYIKIIKKGEQKPVVSKIESETCYFGTGPDYLYRQSVVFKLIHYSNLHPGRYTVHIKNVFPVQEYDKYKLYLEIAT